MGVSLNRIARTAYGKALSSGAYRKLSSLREDRRDRIMRQRIKDNVKALCGPYMGCTASEAGFEVLSIDGPVSDGGGLSIDVMGAMRNHDSIDWKSLASDLSTILGDGTHRVCVALQVGNAPLDHDSKVALKESLGLILLEAGDGVVIKTRGLSVAVYGAKASMQDGESSILDEDVLRKIAFVEGEGCDYSIALVDMGAVREPGSDGCGESLFKDLAMLGADCAIGFREGELCLNGSFDRIGRVPFATIGNIGTFPGINSYQDGASVVLRLSIHLAEGQCSIERGYIPLWCDPGQDPISRVIRIDYHDGEQRSNEPLMDRLGYIERCAGDLRDVRNLMTLQQICDQIDVELPSKYADIAKQTIRKISAQASSVSDGDVFFFMPPFNDPNDKRPSSLSYRLPAVRRALDRGAVFVFSYAPLGDDVPHIVLDDPREAHIALSRHIREMYDLDVIGITGSIGKTSTKDMLQKVLAESFRARGSLRNFNNQVSIGQHVQDFGGAEDVFVQEIGGEHPGGVSRHARMVSPSIAVITNIKDAHIGNFGSREKILENKLGMLEAIDDDGHLFLNADDPLLWKVEVAAPVTYYAVENKDADYHADDIVEKDGKTYFTVVHGDKRVPVSLNVLGHHNVLNAVCAFAIGESLGMSDEAIAAGLQKFETSGSRQNLLSVAGYDLFIDCFNSLPDSVDTSLAVLDSMQASGIKIAVIGDITGMGSMTKEVHERVADIVLKHDMDLLVCYGEQSKAVDAVASRNGKNSISITDPKELENFLMDVAEPGDVILFKASSKMNLADRIDSMFGTLLSDQGFVDHAEIRKVRRGPVEYTRNPKFAVASKCENVGRLVRVKGTVLGKRVVAIDDDAFVGCANVPEVKMPPSIRHIGDRAFSGASNMERVDFPDSMKFVGEEAFKDCASMSTVHVNDGLMHISDRAFRGCSELSLINLPASVSFIGTDAFKDCDKVTVVCEDGSYAHDYCTRSGISVCATEKDIKH